MEDIKSAAELLATGLSKIEAERHAAQGYTFAADVWQVKERKKYYALDVGTSGAFLIEKATGEIYNIKAYGVADQNKKLKADLGNVVGADPAFIHQHRYNYLR